MADFDPKMIEALRNALSGTCTANLCRISVADPIGCPCSFPVFEILHALPVSPDALNALWRGEAVVTPLMPTEDQWGGLARDIMMWLDMERLSHPAALSPKPRALFQHLKDVGRPAPQWLRDEAEMQHLDHVPSKGTRAAIIYRAMLAASPYARKDEP